MEKLFIPVLLGTNRKERMSAHVARWLVGQMKEREEIDTELFDVRDFELPRDHYGTEIGALFPEWRNAIVKADGLVIVAPEYNHGYPGSLKSVIDLLLKEYIHKAVAMVGVSAGPFGGTRVIESMVPMVRELGLAVTFSDLNFGSVYKLFDAEGTLLDAAYERRARDFLDELVWMARALRWARANIPSKFHPVRLATDRLELVAATRDLATVALDDRMLLSHLLGARVSEAWPPPLLDDEAMGFCARFLNENADGVGWTMWYIVRRRAGGGPEHRQPVGTIGFKGKPDAEGMVEVGYSLLDEFQSQGLATEALERLVEWAFSHEEVTRVVADTFPDLAASIRVLEKSGFAQIGAGSEEGSIRFERRRAGR